MVRIYLSHKKILSCFLFQQVLLNTEHFKSYFKFSTGDNQSALVCNAQTEKYFF